MDMTTVRTLRDLGAAVRDARSSAGLTQQDLATRAGLARQWVIQLEGGRTNPTWENVRAVCDALDLTLTLSQTGPHDVDAPLPSPADVPQTPVSQPDGVDLDDLIDKHTRYGRDQS